MKSKRDEFSLSTKQALAAQVGYRCSNPYCRKLTSCGKRNKDGSFIINGNKSLNIGVAAHITGATPGAARYDANLTKEERKANSNGIWLCNSCSKLIDTNEEYYTVEMLRQWKEQALKEAFEEVSSQNSSKILKPFNMKIYNQILVAAETDLNTFKKHQRCLSNPVINFKQFNQKRSDSSFSILELIADLENSNEIIITSPPGSGKTTALLQITEFILSQRNAIAIFIPLTELTFGADQFFQHISHREAFTEIPEKHLREIAKQEKLVLLMDGWNELNLESRKQVYTKIQLLRRDFPKLGVVFSTRRKEDNILSSDRIVTIAPLTENQQIEIAKEICGMEGKILLEHAWLTSGIRDLVKIPLYLIALLTYNKSPSRPFPTTKEEVLACFTSKHEQPYLKEAALYSVCFRFHQKFLTGLAVEATNVEKTTLGENLARSTVKYISEQLYSAGQIAYILQPTVILDTLIDQHLLIRSNQVQGFSFQHQQFQEWYASFKVEELMLSAGENKQAKQELKKIFNKYIWEESILFSCERLSRKGQIEVLAVAASILEALTIDPMLAAEMIYRSSRHVWEKIKDKIIEFVDQWHKEGTIDRAVRFMINTGRNDFASKVWPLILNNDNKVISNLSCYGKYFRSSVLGAEAEKRIASLPEEEREDILTDLIFESGLDGIELAAKITETDPSSKVRISVIKALEFRNARRLIARLLRSSPEEIWEPLIKEGVIKNIDDPELSEFLLIKQQQYVVDEIDPMKKLNILLDMKPNLASTASEVSKLIQAYDFSVNKDNVFLNKAAELAIKKAYSYYPGEVILALLYQLKAGHTIPLYAKNLLQTNVTPIEDESITNNLLQSKDNQNAKETIVTIIGPKSIKKLIDRLIEINPASLKENQAVEQTVYQEYLRLLSYISKTNTASFIQTILSQSPVILIDRIFLFLDLIAKHNGFKELALKNNNEQYIDIVLTIKQWGEIYLSSLETKRHHFAKLATVIGQIASPDLLPLLERLLAEDLSRWREERVSYMSQYMSSFSAIGNNQVVELMKIYLLNLDFGSYAACVLRNIWERRYGTLKEGQLRPWPDFSRVKIRRIEKQNEPSDKESFYFGNFIFQKIEDFLKLNLDNRSRIHTLNLARIALSMPYNKKIESLKKLIKLARTLEEKKDLFGSLICAGEIVSSRLLIKNIKSVIKTLRAKSYLQDNDYNILEDFLELLPFSDRPIALIDALALLKAELKNPWRLRRVLLALSYAPTQEAELLLFKLVEHDKKFLVTEAWLNAIENHKTIYSARSLLHLMEQGIVEADQSDFWTFCSNYIGDFIEVEPSFRIELYNQYKQNPFSHKAKILEQIIASHADAEAILVLIQGYSIQMKTFDKTLYFAIRHAVTEINYITACSYKLHSIPAPELRKSLFAMIKDDASNAILAKRCLITIDEFRDLYGPAISDMRHPDINSHLSSLLETS